MSTETATAYIDTWARLLTVTQNGQEIERWELPAGTTPAAAVHLLTSTTPWRADGEVKFGHVTLRRPVVDLPRAEALAWHAIDDYGPDSPQAIAASDRSHALREAGKHTAR